MKTTTTMYNQDPYDKKDRNFRYTTQLPRILGNGKKFVWSMIECSNCLLFLEMLLLACLFGSTKEKYICFLHIKVF